MSVELKISVEETCDNAIYVYDQTGKYDKSCNETGWGRPNRKVSDAISAEIHIFLPGSEEPIILDVYPNFPSDENNGYEILPADIGEEKFKSGIWRFDYYVRLNSGELLFVSCSKLLKEDIKCCVYDKQVAVTTDNYEDPEVIKSNNVISLYESAVANAKLGKAKETEKIIKLLYSKCNCSC